VKALSKVNLYLEIVGKRADSYHEIKTVFIPLCEPCDEIKIETVPGGIQILSDTPDLPQDERNICWRAAAKFAKAAGIKPSWRISIEKKIPLSAGLGGGSSDAAVVLKILDNLFPGKANIGEIACSLGADVPYFLNPIPAFAEGAGEIIRPVKLDVSIPLVVVNPLFPVSSAWAYSKYEKRENHINHESMLSAIRGGDIAKIAACVRNDLAPALYEKFPLLGILRNSLIEFGALNAEISGSGSSLFAIAKSYDDTVEIADNMRKKYKDSLKIFHCA
jgi:4-diphosphocytidyl-2-C-methyl-D-erythritol kinase